MNTSYKSSPARHHKPPDEPPCCQCACNTAECEKINVKEDKRVNLVPSDHHLDKDAQHPTQCHLSIFPHLHSSMKTILTNMNSLKKAVVISEKLIRLPPPKGPYKMFVQHDDCLHDVEPLFSELTYGVHIPDGITSNTLLNATSLLICAPVWI